MTEAPLLASGEGGGKLLFSLQEKKKKEDIPPRVS